MVPKIVKPPTTRWKPEGRMSEGNFARMSRRELLKVAPVVVLGAFAISWPAGTPAQKRVGQVSDWASALLFLAQGIWRPRLPTRS